jgi:hypothetical protein
MLKGLMRSRFPNVLAIVVSLAALLYLFAGHLKIDQLSLPRLTPVPTEDHAGEILLSHDGYRENAVYDGVLPSRIGQNVRRFGSWVAGDSSVGKAVTTWFPRVPSFSLQVAGYPHSHDCEVYIEAQTKSGAIKRISIPGDEPMESWQVREISLPASDNIVRFRIVSTDNSSRPGGWVGFSQPFRFVRTTRELSKQLAQVLLCVLTAAAALVAVLFPGIWLRQHRPNVAFLWIPVPGFLMLAALGLLCWAGPQSVGVRRISQVWLGPLFVYALYHSVRFPITSFLTKIELRILLVVLLLASLSISRASYSVGPSGELFAEHISRTLQVGDRSDSRIPYHVVQLIAARADPHGSLSNLLLGPNVFSVRTPLVPLAASPLVLAIPVKIPVVIPNQNWTVFDPEGFAAYRIVMIVIACCSLTAAFSLAALFVNEEWAFLVFLVTATAPFVVHETYFTWPKLEAAWFVLLAAYLIMRGRILMAGLLWGVAYLCHPLALLFAPALAAIVCLTAKKRNFLTVCLRPALLVPGICLCVGLWLLVNLHSFSQTSFLSYFQLADGRYYLSSSDWLLSRWNSLANTVLPLYLFLNHSDHPSINSLYQPSPAVVHFNFQYWNTLPFGVGLTYFFFMLRFLWSAVSGARGWLFLVFVLPFVCFTVYWGFVSTGMLREGLHPWVLGVLIFSVVLWAKMPAADHPRLSRACCWGLLLRGPETLSMLLLPSLLASYKWISSQFVLTDCLAIITMLASLSCLTVLTFRQAQLVSNPATQQKQNGNLARHQLV